MAMSPENEKKLLIGLLAVLSVLIAYRIFTAEEPRTAPLTFDRGAKASAPIRRGVSSPVSKGDPLSAFLSKKAEKFPGVARDIFRMYNPEPPRPKPQPKPELTPPPQPLVPEKTPEEIAVEESRADLSKFRFLGYLTEKDSSLFLSKDGELFIVKSGDKVLKNYRVKEAGKDYVILQDTSTSVEVRVELTGGVEQGAPAGRFR